MRKTNSLIRAGLVLAVPLLAGGCKTVIRENIISTIETGIGVTLAENPKTEMYEAKVGYIRSQFYSVPTGKNVENENKTDGDKTKTTTADNKTTTVSEGRKDARSNRADVTPELVSGIRMKSGIEHLLIGLEVSESFAVGKIAVMSPAAVAMYVADARNPEAAKNAAEAVKAAEAAAKEKIQVQLSQTEKIMKFLNAEPDKFRERLKDLAKGSALETNTALETIDPATLEKRLKSIWSGHVDKLYEKLPAENK